MSGARRRGEGTAPVEGRRPQRVADLVRHEVAAILQREVKDPRVGFVTVTDVEMSPDLRVARVFYSVLGEPDQRRDTGRGLASASAYIRREVGRRLHLKVVPELRFVYDTSLERGLRIEAVIESMGNDEPEAPDR